MTSKTKEKSINSKSINLTSDSVNHEEIAWTIIDKYFEHDPNILVKHHLESYNDFFNNNRCCFIPVFRMH